MKNRTRDLVTSLALVLSIVSAAPASAQTKIKHKGDSLTVTDKSKPVRHALEAQYERIAKAQKDESLDELRATRTPDFTVDMPNGDHWNLETSLNYSKAGFEQVEKTESLTNTIDSLDVHGETAVAVVHQRWKRTQMKAGKLRHVETESIQTETWVNTPQGWKLKHIGDIRPGVWKVDGKRIDPAKPYDPDAPPYVADAADKAKEELEARYRENEAAFFARDADRVMVLRHPDFHTVGPDGKGMTREQMVERTRSFINRVEKFDSLFENITALELRGDTAVATVAQRTVREQRFPDGTLHEIRTSAVQRESWIKTTAGWLMWRVDHVKPGPTLVDGKPAEK
jgi:ketosteroid isomerase-like protein